MYEAMREGIECAFKKIRGQNAVQTLMLVPEVPTISWGALVSFTNIKGCPTTLSMQFIYHGTQQILLLLHRTNFKRDLRDTETNCWVPC